MRTITADDVRKYLEHLIDEITEIHEPIRIEGEKKKAIVMVDAEDFEGLLRSDERKRLTSDGKKSAKSLFGMLRHRAKAIPVSIEEMEAAIKKRCERTAG
ncbi:MAG: hypothetical protein BWK80_22350 [Desulfobacteraceae bacterium IS3]|nr:MAG: hypothetical protein BWK80_22350 [Desulfobacteraceae bacterium IS3]